MKKKRAKHRPDPSPEKTEAKAHETADEDSLPPFLVDHGHQITLGIVSLLIFYWFFPEIRYASIFYNDAVSHSAIIRGMDQAWERGGNITDFWMDYINMGHALLRAYQFLFHFTIWSLHKTVFCWMTLNTCFNVCITAMATLLPWSVYKGCRLLGLNRAEAVFSTIGVVLVHEREGYGLGLTNFTYSGYGTYNQLYAMLFFPLAVGYVHQMLRTGHGALRASLAFAATFMAHILTGYFACIWIAIDTLFALITRGRDLSPKTMLVSLSKFTGLVLLWTGHWVIPMAQDGLLQHKSEFEAPWKWTGHGAEKVLTDLKDGLILDADRWYPALTLLAGVGFLYCAWPWLKLLRNWGARQSDRDLMRRQITIQSVVWIALTFGPMTWGDALSILPFSSTMHWHRFFAGAQLALMMASGMFLADAFSRLDLKGNQFHLGATGIIGTCILFPCLWERQAYFYTTNTFWLVDTYQKWEDNSYKYSGMLDFAVNHPNVRYYAGSPWNWGNELKTTGTIPFYALLVQYNVETVGAIHHHQNHSEVVAFRSNIFNPAHLELMNIHYVATPLQKNPMITIPESWVPVQRSINSVLYDTKIKSGFFDVGPIGDLQDALEKPPCADNDGLSRTITYYLTTKLPDHHVYPPMKLAKKCNDADTIESFVTALAAKPELPVPGTIVETSVKPGPDSEIYEATVDMTAAGMLLFKMNYHPGWKLLVDGSPTPTMMVVPSMIGARLEAGKHHVRIAYEVAPLKKALIWVFLASITALIGWTVARYFRMRSAKGSLSPQSNLN